MNKKDICRAITFINYNIPIEEEGNMCIDPDYSTIGFFDGLFTKSLELEYSHKSLKSLWEYSIEMSLKSEGKYSYQNVFCFSKDEWNVYQDIVFWSYEIDVRFPLTFIVFLQRSEYNVDGNKLQDQLLKYNNVLEKELRASGIFYTYLTIDKNDFVICIKSNGYKKILDVIKKLHNLDKKLVYSYTTLSINNKVLEGLSRETNAELYSETIDSISLKGVTNSYQLSDKIILEHKYRELTSELKKVLCTENNKDEFEVYDILGDDDFRFVAKNVVLGDLLEQYGKNGKLSYSNTNSHVRFFLYSSSMRLNVKNSFAEGKKSISHEEIEETERKMNQAFTPQLCNKIEHELGYVKSNIQRGSEFYLQNEKRATICQATWQILQSLKALERAPNKQYDFYTLYEPFRMFAKMINEKLEKKVDITEERNVYDFLCKISMTIQGTLKTDIQFFQINDYNVIAHYAPTKLRAFYSAWVLKLSKFYDSLSETKEEMEYSFIFSPGVFSGTHVKELFEEKHENKHLMLITIPERHIYVPKWLISILGHEVGHFVGHTLRNRALRRVKLMSISTRILSLEWARVLYLRVSDQKTMNYVYNESEFQKQLTILFSREMRYIDEVRGKELHSEETLYRIWDCVNNVLGVYGNNIFSNYLSFMDIDSMNGQKVSEYTNSQVIERIKQQKTTFQKCTEEWEQYATVFRRTELLYDAVRNVKYIMSEMFSDLMSILTLGLLPEDYMLTFKNSEYLYQNEEGGTVASPVNVRIAIVIKVVKILVQKDRKIFRDNKLFMEKWTKCELDSLAQTFKNDEVVRDLIVLSYGYLNALDDYKKQVSKYVSLYERKYIEKKGAAYLLDRQIYDAMFQYLLKCGLDYIKQIEKKPEQIKQREKLIEYYTLFGTDKICDIAQGIEDFLFEYEENVLK